MFPLLTASSSAAPVVKGIASWPWYFRFARDPLGCLDEARRQFGTVFALSPIPFFSSKHKQFIAFDPAINHRVLSNSGAFKTCPIAPRAAEGTSMSRIRGGFQLSERGGHQEVRKVLLPAFSKKAVHECHGDIVNVTEDCLAHWPTGSTTDVTVLARNLSLAISRQLLFGAEPLERADELSHLLEASVRATFFSWAMALPVNIPGLPYWRLARMCDRLAAILDAMIQERRSVPSGRRDVLETLVRSVATDAQVDFVGATSFLFVASFETLTSTMTWTLFLLAQHPEIVADVYDELAHSLGGEPPSPDQCDRLPLLEAVIKEAMRILPPIPILFRRARQAVDLAGVTLRRGDWILLSQYMTHRMPDLFPSPNRFMPTRWFTATPGPYEYFPFGAGAHSCIGYTLSMSVLKISLATILQRFRFTVVPQTRVDRTVRITLNPRHGIPMILHKQDQCFESVPVRGQIHEMVDLPEPHSVFGRSRTYRRKEAA